MYTTKKRRTSGAANENRRNVGKKRKTKLKEWNGRKGNERHGGLLGNRILIVRGKTKLGKLVQKRYMEEPYTVEVGSLHTLRLESLRLVFQTLHTFLVNKL